MVGVFPAESRRPVGARVLPADPCCLVDPLICGFLLSKCPEPGLVPGGVLGGWRAGHPVVVEEGV